MPSMTVVTRFATSYVEVTSDPDSVLVSMLSLGSYVGSEVVQRISGGRHLPKRCVVDQARHGASRRHLLHHQALRVVAVGGDVPFLVLQTLDRAIRIEVESDRRPCGTLHAGKADAAEVVVELPERPPGIHLQRGVEDIGVGSGIAPRVLVRLQDADAGTRRVAVLRLAAARLGKRGQSAFGVVGVARKVPRGILNRLE